MPVELPINAVLVSSFANELRKIASAGRLLLHPAALGAGLGAVGGALIPPREGAPQIGRLRTALGGAVAGGATGAGVRYLPGLIQKSKALSSLRPYAGDIGWMAPSLVLGPAAMAYAARPSKEPQK